MFKSSFSGKAGALILAASIAFTGMSLPVFAESNVSGSEPTISENDPFLETEDDEIEVTTGFRGDNGIESGGNYVVKQNATISQIRIGYPGSATITIERNCTLTISNNFSVLSGNLRILGEGTLMLSASCSDEVFINDGASLTIGQTGASGPTIRGADNKRPWIRVGNSANTATLTINSGDIILNGKADSNWVKEGIYILGSVVFNGGSVTVTGGSKGVFIAGGSFRINGGVLDLKSDYGAIFGNNGQRVDIPEPSRYYFKSSATTDGDLADTTLETINANIRSSSIKRVQIYKKTYRVRFDTNGIGAAIGDQVVDSGRKAVKPADPITTGSTFGGWFIDSACTQAYDFNSPVTWDVTLYAKWTRVVNPSNPDNPNVNPSNPEDTTEVRKDPVQVNNFVERMYTKALKRASEEGGKNDWANQLLTGKSDGAALAKGFICSNEFVNKDMSNEEFLDTLYETFFDRPADEGGKATWLAKLNEGNSRTSVLAGFVNSTEFGNLCENFGIARGTMEEDGSSIYNEGVYNFVKRNYTKTLGRNGEIAGIEDWCHRINTGKLTMKDVAVEFLHSTEFLNKNLSNEEYVKVLYRTFLGREADASGLADWTGQLDRGEKTRDEIVSGFSDSQEFNDIMKQYQ